DKNAALSFCFSSRRRHTRFSRDWSSDVCSSDLRVFGVKGTIGSIASATAPASASATASIPKSPLLHTPSPTGCGRLRYRARGGRSEERRVGKECRSRGASEG